jgi:bacteriorhodopsin
MTERSTLLLTKSALGAVAILQGLVALRTSDHKTVLSNSIGSTVCSIAFIHYLWLSSKGDTTSIRYSDWLLTLPLLLLEIYLICDMENQESFLLAVTLILFMLYSGWKAESSNVNSGNRKAWLFLGCLNLLLVYMIVLGQTGFPDEFLQAVTIILFLSWSLYGVVSASQGKVEDSSIQSAYDLLDLSTKAIFGIVVAISSYRSSVV